MPSCAFVSRVVEIALCIEYYVAHRLSAVTATGEVIQIGIRPAILRG